MLKVSYIIPLGRWSASMRNKFPNYHIYILLGDFSAKVDKVKKVKSLYLINLAPRHEDVYGSRDTALPFLISAPDGGSASLSGRFTSK
jgi:hypothetical protein